MIIMNRYMAAIRITYGNECYAEITGVTERIDDGYDLDDEY